MNRHQSNPFLAGWEEKDDVDAQGVFNEDIKDDENNSNEVSAGARRHSSHRGEGNPFGEQRATDRRLYHRNMSSFEAASLQLEQQQRLQDNGTFNDQSVGQTDLIAKMTADFQSAIETNDKQFAIDSDTSGNPIEMSAFDPFETIVDDDISIPSPASSASQTKQKSGDKFFKTDDIEQVHNYESEIKRPTQIDFDSVGKNVHDSIDDDEDELVSTPVRNIKSISQSSNHHQASKNNSDLRSKIEEQFSNADVNHDTNLEKHGVSQQAGGSTEVTENTDSIAKASLFASLLASAESGGQQASMVDGNTMSNVEDPNETIDSDYANSASQLGDMEHATHVIKGSPQTADGNVDRPVSFFDPFETVIDKDALTSLMNDNQQQSKLNHNDDNYDESNDLSLSPRTPQPTPIHRPQGGREEVVDENECLFSPQQQQKAEQQEETAKTKLRPSFIAENASIETVIENATTSHKSELDLSAKNISDASSAPISQDDETTNEKSGDTNRALAINRSEVIPRPTSSAIGGRTGQQVPAKAVAATAKKSKQPKKKSSFQEDSSDSSDDDDRIQIVIKARDITKTDTHTAPIIMPLLPPPPSKSSMKQARERGQVEDIPSPVMSYKTRAERRASNSDDSFENYDKDEHKISKGERHADSEPQFNDKIKAEDGDFGTKDVGRDGDDDDDDASTHGQFIIPMTHSDDEGDYGKPDTPLYDEDTSYALEEFPAKFEGSGWEMMLRYPPKKKLTSNRFWKKIFVKLAEVPLALDKSSKKHQQQDSDEHQQTCIALQVFDKPEDRKPIQEIPIQATYTVSEISSQQFDQFGKIFTLKLQYIFYKERVGVRQGQLARFIHTGHIGSSTTSGGHGVDPISIGAIKRMGAPIEHSPQISQIIKLGCTSYSEIKQFKNCLEDHLFKMPIYRDKALSTYKTEEVQMAVRDETYLELNQVGTVTRQLARVRLFFLSFLNGMPTIEVGINDIHRQGREVVGRMDILPVVTEEWIRLEAWELHSTVEKDEFENPDSRIIKLTPPDATFFELMRFRVRPPKNRELPLQISANMSVTRTKVSINCEVMVPGCVSRKHGQIPCEGIAIKVWIPECWIYFFREEKHFRMGSKKSVNRRPGKVKGIERFLGGGGLQDINDESSLIEVTSGQAKYEHHHHAIVWRAARWPKESQSAYVQNTMKIRLPLTAYDKMPDNFYEFVHVEYTMPATTVSHTTLRSISVNPCDDEPPEKYVKYSAKYEYKVKMRLSVNLGLKPGESQPEASPIIIMKQPDLPDDLQREEDSDDDEDEDGEGSEPEAGASNHG